MATDIKLVIGNLLNFYDFAGKTIISVGAGGGQMIEYGRNAKKVIAIDSDPKAIEQLENRLQAAQLKNFQTLTKDFYNVDSKGDVVLFEFCLHEMLDPEAAIKKAKEMAPDVVIIDHVPDSEWAYFIVETEKAQKSTKTIRKFKIKKEQKCEALQFFNDYREIFEKVKSQGEEAINRIGKFKNLTNLSINMPYALYLL